MTNTASQMTPGQRRQRRSRRRALLRAAVQLLFFLSMPGAFVAGFSGVKNIFQHIGTGEMLSWNSFVATLVGLCAFTVLFGRYFCGYVCAFGSLGDFVFWLSGWIQRKLFHRNRQYTLPDSLTPWGQKVKFLLLSAIVILCALGVYDRLSGWSPWSAFSFLTALHFSFIGYWPGVILLVLIVAGMAVKERFFCQFLCPMGAVFALLPVLPFADIQRDAAHCIPGCQACKRQCPVSIKLAPGGFRNGECIACERCTSVCPKGNLRRWEGKILPQALAIVIKAALFFALGVLLHLCRFF